MRWSLRAQKLYYMLGVYACITGTVAVIAWGAYPPNPTPTTEHIETPVAANNFKDTEQPRPTRQDFAKLWDRPLRRALYDPPPPKPEIRQLPPLRVELMGTIIEPGNSMAIVRSEQGRVEYKRIGDMVGPAESPASIVEIGPDTIVVERSDQRVSLGVKAKELR